MKKAITILLASMMVTGLLAGCNNTTDTGSADTGADTGTTDTGADDAEAPADTGSGEKQKLTFTSWANTGEIVVLSRAVDAYNELQDNVEVVFEPTGGDGYETKLITALTGGQAWDTYYSGDGYMGKLVDNGTAADLTDFMATEDSYVSVDDFPAGSWGAALRDGRYYGIAPDCNPRVLYYQPAMIEELGVTSPQEHFEAGTWTVDAWTEINAAMNAAGKKGFLFGGDTNAVYGIVGCFGGSVWQADGTYKFDDTAVAALKYCEQEIKNGNWGYSGLLPEGQGEDASFMSGQAGFIAAGKWQTPTFAMAEIEHDYIPFPSTDGTEYPPQQIHAAYMCVDAQSELLEEAMKFATYYCGADGQAARLAPEDGVPGNAIPAVLGIDDIVTEVMIPEHVDYLFGVRETGWVLGGKEYPDSQYPGFYDDAKALLEEIWVNGKTTDEILPQIEALAAEYIAEANA